jgi:glycine/serine hydroxymethyltransferase
MKDPAVRESDPEVARLIELEFERQSQTLCLIPSENHVSIPGFAIPPGVS